MRGHAGRWAFGLGFVFSNYPRNLDGRGRGVWLAVLDAALVPAPKEVILKALTRVKLSVNPRNQGADDAKYQRAIYVDELSEFPADVVVEALQRLGRRDWFPNGLAGLGLFYL